MTTDKMMSRQPLKTTDILNRPVDVVKGIGNSRRVLFYRVGVSTVGDLIEYYPSDYQFRGDPKTLNSIVDGEYALVRATADSRVEVRYIRRKMSIQRIRISDETGDATVVWFNQPYLKNYFIKGKEYSFWGKVSTKAGSIELTAPEYMHVDAVDPERSMPCGIVPVYRLTDGLSQNTVRNAVSKALSMVMDAEAITESLPEWIRSRHSFISRDAAIKAIHYPEDRETLSQARRRLAFEELLGLHVYILKTRRNYLTSRKKYVSHDSMLVKSFMSTLPFKLTNAQMRVYGEIATDMETPRPMNRLVQGDVGSGKTVVALLALIKAAGSGYQGVFMAPTGILAAQHFSSIKGMLSGYGIRTALLAGGTDERERSEILAGIRDGRISIVVGTHALLEQDIKFAKLALAVTDEQHRFGVRQRAAIAMKSANPDILALSATPIPRTLALALYGDVDISTIEDMPPGRKSVKTHIVNEQMRDRVNGFIRRTVSEGHQAYIVCPVVDGGQTGIEAQSAVELAERIASKDLSDLRVGLLHGRMRTEQKDMVLKDFREKKIDVLVCTTVVEVGVDIPNATLMVIENAERYGLAQLHQLRGRVGRSDLQSWCILYNQGNNPESVRRMDAIQKYDNGFIIAEKDLELRGPGDFFGTRQHGLPEMKIANLYNDTGLMELAAATALELADHSMRNDGTGDDIADAYLRRHTDTKGWFW